ncbi:unnamed protein product [Phytophthora fragariaefolia]|uniref:Unnamed protein product n=1 Tax=Phytophthora fragariaefolia TaxID=1490495 RepID=A0A9W6TRJ3_9STRA|nr:unnamed protein product [Phytophthora fragariaefolia]
MSQSQSQNLLGSSQDDHWQAQHVQPAAPPAALDYNEKLQELEKSITQAFAEQICQQKQQQQELMAQLASPIEKAIQDIKEKLTVRSDDTKQQNTSIAEIAHNVKVVNASVIDLHEQNLKSKTAYEENQQAVVSESAAVKEALTELQVRVEIVEGCVKSCSDKVSRILEEEASKHEELLSVVAATSCNCAQENFSQVAESYSGPGQITGKRKRSPHRSNASEKKSAHYASSASADGPSPRTITRSSPGYEVDSSIWSEDEANSIDLHIVFERIQDLGSKRRRRLQRR